MGFHHGVLMRYGKGVSEHPESYSPRSPMLGKFHLVTVMGIPALLTFPCHQLSGYPNPCLLTSLSIMPTPRCASSGVGMVADPGHLHEQHGERYPNFCANSPPSAAPLPPSRSSQDKSVQGIQGCSLGTRGVQAGRPPTSLWPAVVAWGHTCSLSPLPGPQRHLGWPCAAKSINHFSFQLVALNSGGDVS